MTGVTYPTHGEAWQAADRYRGALPHPLRWDISVQKTPSRRFAWEFDEADTVRGVGGPINPPAPVEEQGPLASELEKLGNDLLRHASIFTWGGGRFQRDSRMAYIREMFGLADPEDEQR